MIEQIAQYLFKLDHGLSSDFELPKTIGKINEPNKGFMWILTKDKWIKRAEELIKSSICCCIKGGEYL